MIALVANDLQENGRATTIPNPTLDAVLQCLARMDGVYFTELSLADSDASGLVVTGGWCGRFMCEYMSAYRNLLLVSTETGQGEELEILRGGDLFPDNWVTDKGKVESALTYFLANVDLAPEFRWQ